MSLQHGRETDVVVDAGCSRASHLLCHQDGRSLFLSLWPYIKCFLILKHIITFFLLVFGKKWLALLFMSLKILWPMDPDENSKVEVRRCFLTWSLLSRQSCDRFLSISVAYVTNDVVWSIRQRRPRRITCLLRFCCSPIPHAFTSKTQFLLVSSSFKGLSWGYWTLLCSHWQRRGNAKPTSDRCGGMKTQLPWLLLQWQLWRMSSTPKLSAGSGLRLGLCLGFFPCLSCFSYSLTGFSQK